MTKHTETRKSLARHAGFNLGCELVLRMDGSGRVVVGELWHGRVGWIDKSWSFRQYPRWWWPWDRTMVEACKLGMCDYRSRVRQCELNERAAATMQDLADMVAEDFAE